MKYMILVIKK